MVPGVAEPGTTDGYPGVGGTPAGIVIVCGTPFAGLTIIVGWPF